jgi:DNA-binding Xre family transcriptional regulator
MSNIRLNLVPFLRSRGFIHPPDSKHGTPGSINIFQVCQLTGMGYNQLYRVIAGNYSNMTLTSIGRFCDTLGCTPADLIEYIPPAASGVQTLEGPQRPVGADVLNPDW